MFRALADGFGSTIEFLQQLQRSPSEHHEVWFWILPLVFSALSPRRDPRGPDAP